MEPWFLKRILLTPTTTPREVLYLETGIIDPEHNHQKGKILMRNRLEKSKNELIETILQLEGDHSWSARVEEIRNRLEINDHYETASKGSLKKEVSKKTATYQYNRMKGTETSKSKVSYLMSGRRETTPSCNRKPYMNKLNRKQVSTIFKARSRMLDIKNNFRGKYNDLKCRGCGQPPETQEHVFEECPKLHPDESTKVHKTEIFDEEPEPLKSVSSRIDRIMTILSQSEVYVNNMRPCQLGSHSN